MLFALCCLLKRSSEQNKDDMSTDTSSEHGVAGRQGNNLKNQTQMAYMGDRKTGLERKLRGK